MDGEAGAARSLIHRGCSRQMAERRRAGTPLAADGVKQAAQRACTLHTRRAWLALLELAISMGPAPDVEAAATGPGVVTAINRLRSDSKSAPGVDPL